MKKNDLHLRKELLRIYRIPPSREKTAFFQSRRWRSAYEKAFFSPEAAPGIYFPEFLRIQAGYIRLRNWFFSLGLFLAVLLFSAENIRAAGIDSRQFLGALSACIPYLALTTMAEGSRSARFGMDELEMHTRFSLHSVICARLFLAGALNLIVLTVLIPFLCTAWGTGPAVTSGILLAPYLLTCTLDLMILRRSRNRNSITLCAAAGTGVSAGCLILSAAGPAVYGVLSHAALPAVFLLGAAAALELRKYLRQSEESIWNYTSTV